MCDCESIRNKGDLLVKKRLISLLLSAVMLTAYTSSYAEYESQEPTERAVNKYDLGTFERKAERLGRGLVAMKTDKGIYLTWRLYNREDTIFGSASENVEFIVYRDGEEIAEVSDTTNYTDAAGTEDSRYSVAAVTNGTVGEKCEEVSAFESGENYFDIPLEAPQPAVVNEWIINEEEENQGHYETKTVPYSVNDCSCGDLDGDGEYEIVVRWNAGISHMFDGGFDGPTLLDAYKLDGTRLWENPINLGDNVFSDEHNMQFLVFDFDEDGHAEITCQTSAGSMDACGNYVNEVSADENIRNIDNSEKYIDKNGRILKGAELFTIFDGADGRALDTIYYPIPICNEFVFGDYEGNRATRFLADVSYLDGEKPYAVYWRGYYKGQKRYGTAGRTGIFGASFDGERLNPKYVFDTYDVLNSEYADGYTGIPAYTEGNEIYTGNGNHNITTADVDGDGKDEFISGSLCFEVNDEDKLMPKWCSFRGHGDALHIGDYDPEHEGLEYFSVHETGFETYTDRDGNTSRRDEIVTLPDGTEKSLDFGMTVYDAKTGEEMFHAGSDRDTGRGVMLNVGAGGYYTITGHDKYVVGANGNAAETDSEAGASFRIFWDGDLFEEGLDVKAASETGQTLHVMKWNGLEPQSIFYTKGSVSINGTKSNPCLQADLLGDWREEIAAVTDDGTALRVFTTNIPTKYKMQTLMHDSVYRAGVAAEQTAYNQPPHIGYYLSEKQFANYPSLDENAYFADDFSSYMTTGVTGQTDKEQNSAMGKLNIHVGFRDNGGDGSSRAALAANALALVSGANATSSRGASFAFSEECHIPAYADVAAENLLDMQFDMMFTDENSTLQIFGLTSNETVADGKAVNDPYLSAANNPDIPIGEWVHVRFAIQPNGQAFLDISQDGTDLCVKSFEACGESIEKFAAYGNKSSVLIDNLVVKEEENKLSVVTVVISDENDNPVGNASVAIGGKTVKTDEKGTAVFVTEAGKYPFSVSKLGYEGDIPTEIEINEKSALMKYTLKLSEYVHELTSVSVSGGAEFVSAPYTKDYAQTAPFTVEALDQNGFIIKDVNTEWSIMPENDFVSVKDGIVEVKKGFRPHEGHQQKFTITAKSSYGNSVKTVEKDVTVNDYMFYEPGTGCYGGVVHTLPSTQETTLTIPIEPGTEYITLPETIRFIPSSSQKLSFDVRIETKDIYSFRRYINFIDKDGKSPEEPFCFALNKMGMGGHYESSTRSWIWDDENMVFGDLGANKWVNVTMLFITDEEGNTTNTIKIGNTERTIDFNINSIAKIEFGAEKANSGRMVAFKNFVITNECDTEYPIFIPALGIYADKMDIQKEAAGNKAVFTVKVREGEEMPELTMYAAEYNNGRLINLKQGENVKTDDIVTITLDLPETSDYKIMLWDKNMRPVIKALTNIQ